MIILKMSEQELHAHWDKIEHELGEMPLAHPYPSLYLLRAYERKLVTWDQALELLMAATGIGMTDP